jgi:hypothetical protein
MKSRSASEWAKAYDSIHQELTVKGLKPKLQTFNNEASTAFKNLFTANDILGLLKDNMYTHLVPSCIITGVKVYTS